jgi:hypothetical protein
MKPTKAPRLPPGYLRLEEWAKRHGRTVGAAYQHTFSGTLPPGSQKFHGLWGIPEGASWPTPKRGRPRKEADEATKAHARAVAQRLLARVKIPGLSIFLLSALLVGGLLPACSFNPTEGDFGTPARWRSGIST